MPYTDSLAPPLTDTEKAIVKNYGGFTAFCLAYGLKPTNPEEYAEAVVILHRLALESDGYDSDS